MIPELCLVAAVIGVLFIGVVDARRLQKEGGVLLRRERRRVILATVFAIGVLAWPLVFLCVPKPPMHGTAAWAGVGFALAWPIALIGSDLVVTRTHVPTQEDMEKRAATTQAAGNYLLGAVFAVGILLAVLNRTQSGHHEASARIMLTGMLAVIVLLIPSVHGDPTADLTWSFFAVQRVVLHVAIGFFILAVVSAWSSGGGDAVKGPPIQSLFGSMS
jgi:hypothetical protein